MYLEELPNELFGEIFSYLSGNDCVFAFSLLNQHFECLIEEYSQGFDFQFVRKKQFDWFFYQYNKQWWKSLKLSNQYIFGQIEYFFQCYSLIDDISQLESLSLIQIEHLDQSILFNQLSFLTNLVSLTLKPICGQNFSSIDLPKLKQLVVSSCRDTHWIDTNFPQIQSLDYEIITCCSSHRQFIWPKQLKSLKIIYEHDEDSLLIPSSLKHLSELHILEIYQKETGNRIPNGQIWEQLISSSFSQLRKFRFYFSFVCSYKSMKHIENLFSTFSTSFYINEKKCFSQCDVYQSYERVSIYSIPLTFDQYQLSQDFYQWKIYSLSNHSQKNLYKNLKTLMIEPNIDASTPWLTDESSIKSILHFNQNYYFNNIEQIKFSRIYHFYYQRHAKTFSTYFFTLFKTMPRLCSLEMRFLELKVFTEDFTSRLICQFLSKKIRSLKIYSNDYVEANYLSGDQLNQIIEIFSKKCENLSINLRLSTEKVIVILKNFQQLQCLHVNVQINSHLEITNRWIENQQIGLNCSNCYVFNYRNIYYFFLNKET